MASAGSTHPEISALVTCYFEERTIDEFYAKLSAALEGTGRSYEIIFVNDGSTDGTWAKLKSIFEKDPKVSAVSDLFRNAGQAAAVTAAIAEASGDIVLSIDSDLQLDPADLGKLLEFYDQGFDIVSGKRMNRRDSFSRVLPSLVANAIMRRASGTKIKDFGCTFKLYKHSLLRGFQFGPTRIFNPVIVMAHTNRIAEVPVSHFPRPYGKSGWTFRKLWNYQMEQLMLLIERIFQYISLFAAAAAALFILRILIELVTPVKVLQSVSNGLVLNAIVIAFLILLGCMSIVGEFTVRSASMTRGLPRYIVRETLRRDRTNVTPSFEDMRKEQASPTP